MFKSGYLMGLAGSSFHVVCPVESSGRYMPAFHGSQRHGKLLLESVALGWLVKWSSPLGFSDQSETFAFWITAHLLAVSHAKDAFVCGHLNSPGTIQLLSKEKANVDSPGQWFFS